MEPNAGAVRPTRRESRTIRSGSVERGYKREESILPTTWTMRTGTVLCAGILLAGCSTGDSTDASAVASSDSGGQSSAAIDPAALDTGDYPTTPAAPFGLATWTHSSTSRLNAWPNSSPFRSRSTRN